MTTEVPWNKSEVEVTARIMQAADARKENRRRRPGILLARRCLLVKQTGSWWFSQCQRYYPQTKFLSSLEDISTFLVEHTRRPFLADLIQHCSPNPSEFGDILSVRCGTRRGCCRSSVTGQKAPRLIKRRLQE